MNRSAPLFVITILVLGFVLQPSVFAFNEKKENKEFKIPPGLSEIAPGVFSLGKAKDVNGNDVDGIMFVHYKNESAKQQAIGGKPPSKNLCYSFLTKGGVKWTNPEPWVVNPVNRAGLQTDFILNNIASNIDKWEDATDGVIGGSSTQIMGDGSIDTTLVTNPSSPDNINEVYFADISSTGVIAVTTTWYNTFSGQIVEWDQVYDDKDFGWSDSSFNGVPGKMDFENISTHEIGHAVGMGHPSDSCTSETMYRYASFDETIKRTLNSGDIAGIDKLY